MKLAKCVVLVSYNSGGEGGVGSGGVGGIRGGVVKGSGISRRSTITGRSGRSGNSGKRGKVS